MINRSVLDNGIRVITERIPSIHSVALGVWVEHGSRHEPAAFNGSSHFIEHMLFKGTSTRDARQIAREIDSVGGLLNAFTSREYSCYYAKVLGEALPFAVELLADLLLASQFASEEVEKERRVIQQEISMISDSPEELVHELLSSGFWPGHALGRPVLGSHETVSTLTREQLLDFMYANYCGRRLLVCAAGDVEHAQMVDLVAKAFAALPEGTTLSPQLLPEARSGVHTLQRDLDQVHLCLAAPGLPQNDHRRFPLYLVNTLLGASMSSRLFQKVREERGLAYSIYSYLNAFSDCGSLVIYAGVSPQDVQAATDVIVRELRELASVPVSVSELGAARNQLKGNLLLSLESTDNRMSRLAKDEMFFSRSVPVEEVVRGIESVGVEDILDLARDLLDGHNLHLQLIGNVRERDITQMDLCFDTSQIKEPV